MGGQPIIGHLVRKGFEVIAYDIDPARRDAVVTLTAAMMAASLVLPVTHPGAASRQSALLDTAYLEAISAPLRSRACRSANRLI
jgi:hypothetical protein